MLTHARRQYAVGQGCFHAGAVGQGHRPRLGAEAVLYVYDCGAMSSYAPSLEAAIDAFHASAGPREIDFLFLSHMHLDHVAGVERLCAPAAVTVGTVVLPLLNDIDRVICFARAAAEDPDGITPFFEDLVTDPAGAITRALDPQQIIFVRRGEGPAPGPDEPGESLGGPRQPRDPGPRDGAERRLKWRVCGRGPVEAGGPSNDQAPSRSTDGERSGAPDIYTIADTLAFEVASADPAQSWILAPYVDVEVGLKRDRFIAAAADLLGLSSTAFEQQSADPAFLLLLVTSCKAELAAAYQKVANLNVTSLCLLSAPYSPLAEGRWRLERPNLGWFAFIRRVGRRVGWLGTGDADLKKLARREAFLDHYAARLGQVGTILLPHHGSSHNFHPDLLDRIEPALCVAAADSYSTWQHPGARVIQAACSRRIPLWVATGDGRSEVREAAAV